MVGSLEVADIRPAAGVVHRVGHVANQHDVLAVLGHLPQSEGTPQDTHVGVDSQQDHVADLLLFQDAPDFLAVVTDIVPLSNLQHVSLAFPGSPWIAAHGLQFLSPLAVFCQVVILAPVGLVEWIDTLFLGGDLVTPLGDVLGQTLGPRHRLGAFPGRMVLVRVHATAGGVDDRGTL